MVGIRELFICVGIHFSSSLVSFFQVCAHGLLINGQETLFLTCRWRRDLIRQASLHLQMPRLFERPDGTAKLSCDNAPYMTTCPTLLLGALHEVSYRANHWATRVLVDPTYINQTGRYFLPLNSWLLGTSFHILY